MFEHVVLLKLHPDTPDEKVRALAEAFAALPAKIPQIRDFHFGPNVSDRHAGYHYVLFSRFDSKADLDAYISHPDHVAVVDGHVKPILESIAVADLDRSTG